MRTLPFAAVLVAACVGEAPRERDLGIKPVALGTEDGGVPLDGGGGGSGGDLPPPPTPGDCGAVTYDGTCAGTMLSFCEQGMLFTYDCAMCGMTCGCEAGGWCDCTGQPGGGGAWPDGGTPGGGSSGAPCGAIDYYGACQGSVLSWCEQGTLVTIDCAMFGAQCAFQDPMIGFNCL